MNSDLEKMFITIRTMIGTSDSLSKRPAHTA
jgi:hypothetical protein